MTEPTNCEFNPSSEVTTMTQEGNMGVDGSATALQVAQVRKVTHYRCRYCLREVAISSVSKDGLSAWPCSALADPYVP